MASIDRWRGKREPSSTRCGASGSTAPTPARSSWARTPGTCARPNLSSASSRLTPPSAAVLEVLQHGEHSAVIRLGRLEPQLLEDAGYVLLDGALGDEQALRDPRVREALRHQSEHVTLARRELVVRVAPRPRHELRDDLGVE